jgi:hypothetical protein
MRRALILSLSLPLLAGCSDYDVIGPGGRNLEGSYSYAGAVDDHFGHTIAGDLVITRQFGDRADVSIDWIYYERGQPIFEIRTDRPAVADLDRYGRIYFEFEGEMFLHGDIVWFRLIHDGRLDHQSLHGEWRLQTDLPTTDRGSFTARR